MKKNIELDMRFVYIPVATNSEISNSKLFSSYRIKKKILQIINYCELDKIQNNN